MRSAAKIIFGEPVAKDAFGGGGHDRSATALADGIRQVADKQLYDKNGSLISRPGGAIGLEGAWGSGKSSVIDIAKGKLGQNYHVFTFDLWRHQTDVFRRALLEEFLIFTKGLKESGVEIDLDMKKKWDEVKNRKTITTTTSKRRYTLVGVLLILLIPLLPLVYYWLTPAALQGVEDAGWRVFQAALGYALASIGTFIFVFSMVMKETERESFSGWAGWITGGASHILTLSRQEKENETEQTIRDEDPTTVEFRQVFESILKPVQSHGRRVVFVLDNIDRLPADDVQKVWSDMRSLVSSNGKDRESSVVAVIPYDRDHVGQAFPAVKVARVIKEDSEHPLEIVSDVFEKTFDRIVKVSALVPSDWKTYLEKHVRDAFGNGPSRDDVEKLFRLLRYQLQREGAHPTPRRIISFVNDVGGLWVQWENQGIPLPTIALYALHRSVFDRDPSILSHKQPVDIRFERIVHDPDYAKNLAALAFNVAPPLANQVRLGQPILSALTGRSDSASLGDLSKSPGFHEAFQDELGDLLKEWVVDSPESIGDAALVVAKTNLPDETRDAVWQKFGDILPDLSVIDYKSLEAVSGLFTIVEKQTRQTPTSAAGIIREKFEGSTKTEGLESQFSDGMHWLSIMKKLCDAISASGDPGAARAFWATKTPSSFAKFSIGVAIAFDQLRPDQDFNRLGFASSSQDLTTELLEMAVKNPAGYAPAAKVLVRHLKGYEYAHMERIAQILQKEEDLEKVEHLLRAGQVFLRNGEFSEFVTAMTAVVRNGIIADRGHRAETDGKYAASAIALVFTALVTGGDRLTTPRGSTESPAVIWYNGIMEDASSLTSETISKMAEAVAVSTRASDWISIAVKAPGAGFMQAVLKMMSAEEKFWIRDLPAFASSFDKLEDIIGVEGAQHFLAQCRFDEELESAFAHDQVRNVSDRMLAAVTHLDNDAPARAILKFADKYLGQLDQAQWETALVSSTDERRLLISMQKNTGLLIKGAGYVSALTSTAIAVLEGRFDPGTSPEWSEVLKALPPSKVAPLRAQIVGRMHSAAVTQEGSERFITHFPTIASKLKFSATVENAEMALAGFLWCIAGTETPAADAYIRLMRSEIDACLEKLPDGEIKSGFLDAASRP